MAQLDNKNKISKSAENSKKVSSAVRKRHSKSVRQSQFTSGSGGLVATRKLNLKRVIPLVIVVALAGGYLVFQGFAGTYSVCKNALSSDQNKTYNQQCVSSSEEASVIRLYQTVLNTTPAQKDVQFWSSKLLNKQFNLNEVTRQFIESGDFKKRHGSLTHDQFITLVYNQGLGRTPDAATRTYWQERLNNGASTRQSMTSALVQSDEMKTRLADQVSRVLAISTFSPLDSSKRSIADGRSQIVLSGEVGTQCVISASATETWLKESKKGTVDINVSDQGDEEGCGQFKITKLSVFYNIRGSGEVRVSQQQTSSTKDVDARQDYESLQSTVSESDQVLRIEEAFVEVKDTRLEKCYEFQTNLQGSVLNPSIMKQSAVKNC